MATSSGPPAQRPLESLIEEELDNLKPISPSFSIYTVPPKLRRLNERAYTPQLVSIGPLHHGRDYLPPWSEEVKLRYFKAFLYQTGISLIELVDAAKGWEERARNCYKERFDLKSNDFLRMMLVDACFIIEVIVRAMVPNELKRIIQGVYPRTDSVVANYPELRTDSVVANYPELIDDVQTDMILLENQIPFFILEDIFYRGYNDTLGHSFFQLSTFYLYKLTLFRSVYMVPESGAEIAHFLDLLRLCHIPSDRSNHTKGSFIHIPNAEELHGVGTKFKCCTPARQLEMNYNDGILEIPQIHVDGQSEVLLRNLIALETCHYPFDGYITDYASFMGMLIKTSKDVDLLKRKRIVRNNLSDSAAVASLFSNVGMETRMLYSYYFARLSKNMKRHYNVPCNQLVPWNKWKDILKRDYCGTPWMFASTVAAIILLILTLIQTIFAVISS